MGILLFISNSYLPYNRPGCFSLIVKVEQCYFDSNKKRLIIDLIRYVMICLNQFLGALPEREKVD